MSGQAIRTMRFRRDAIYHLLVQDEAGGLLPCKFFHGGYLEGRLKPGQLLILHGKVEIDRLRPARLEMINPQIELLNSDELDSTEVGRIVPIYEAIGTFSSKQIRRAMYAAVQLIDPRMPDVLPESLRRRLGYPYWSLSAYLKLKVKNAVDYINDFEVAVAAEARQRGVDGVICGHIHKAEMRQIDGILYCNDGDWVESCTALVEHKDGRLEILEWAKVRQVSMMQYA